jgi:3-phosphoshikimate 1-carboxyvinyltransferase
MKKLHSSPVDKTHGGLKGTVRVPGDKSISHRALILGALAEGTTQIVGLLEGEDVLRTARALIALGVQVLPPGERTGAWKIIGAGKEGLKPPRSALYLGNSGTSARLLMGTIAGFPISATLLGDPSLSRRPMGRVIKPLAQMGVQFQTSSSGDKLPLRIIGSPSVRPIHYTMQVPSAQVKSAIILAAMRAPGETVITEPQPTRDHTERMLRFFGENIGTNEGQITVRHSTELKGRNMTIPSDPSSAAFLTVAALITPASDILIPNVCVNPLRTGVYDTLREMGADIVFENPRDAYGEPIADIHVRSSRLKGVTVPPERAASMIDEFPILAVAASFAEGTTHMSNLSELRVKESDRLSAIAKGLSSAGVKVEAGEDSLTITGTGTPPKGGCEIQTLLDHRIAMSFLIMGLATAEKIQIDDGETINTSFPYFTDCLNRLGASIASA